MKRVSIILGLAALGLTFAVPESRAQCRTRSYYGGSYGSGYYSSRSYYPSSFAPSYSYSQSYDYAPAKKVVKEEYQDPVFVRFQAVVPLLEYKVVNLPSYGSVYVPPPANGQSQAQAGAKAPVNGNGAGAQPSLADSKMDQLFAQNQQILKGLQTLDAKVTSIEARVEKIERTRAPYAAPLTQPPPVPAPPKGKSPEEGPPPKEEPKEAPKNGAPVGTNTKLITLNRNKCAACHSRDNAPEYGGEFVLSENNGSILGLSDAQLVSMQRQITKGKMPKVSVKRSQDLGITAMTKEEADLWFEEIDRQINLERAGK